MTAVLRIGALAVGVALAVGGVGEVHAADAARRAPAPKARKRGPAAAAKAQPAASEPERRSGPRRVVVSTRYAELPRIDDAQREALADSKRDEAIEGLKRLVNKLDAGSPQRAAMLYRLSELYWEKSKYLYMLEMRRHAEAEKAHDAALARGEKQPVPKADHRESERYRAETMGIYERLLNEFPKYERRDEVLFSLGYNLQELERREEAIRRYQQLIEEFPRSEFVPDTYIQLGNHYFDVNQLLKARESFEKARASKVPKTYAYAVYKLAWCDYNSGDYEAGLAKLHEVVDYAEAQGQALGDLKTEALNDLTVFYVQLNRPDEAVAYFKKKASPRRVSRLLARTAAGFADKAGLMDSAIKVYRVLLHDEPMGPAAPEHQRAVVRAYEGLRQRGQVRTEMKRMVDLYSPGGAWWKANEGKTGVLRNAFDVTEEALRTMVTEYHQEAQKTKQVETYRLARDIYRQYVDAFASSEDPQFVADFAFNLRFYYAEILWTLEEWEPAAHAYDAVVHFKIPERDGAREVSKEDYREAAAYSAILAYNKLVKIERGQLGRSDLRDGEKVDERKDKGGVERQTRVVKRDASQQEARALSRFEEKLIQAVDTFIERYPGKKDEIDLRYQAAVMFYDKNHFVEAARRFGDIIQKFPEDRRSQDAADLTMYVLETRQEWLELNRLARRFQANKRLMNPKAGGDTGFARRVARVVEGSQYKWIHEVVWLKDKDAARAADEFIKFVGEFPRSESADRALYAAMGIFREAAQLDRGVEAGERVLRDYRGSDFELPVRYTLGKFYEQLAEFRKSAAMYESFVDAYDALVQGRQAAAEARRQARATGSKPRAPSAPASEEAEEAAARKAEREKRRQELFAEAEKRVADALFNAGLWWEGIGESQKAISAYGRYVSRFRDSKDVPVVALNVALIHEKEGRWAEAARAYERFVDDFARDGRVGGAQLYIARHRALLAAQKLRESGRVERLQGELTRGFARLSAEERKGADVLGAYAHARFLALEPQWETYTKVRLDRVATLRRDLLSKQRELQRLEKGYTDVLAIGAGEWAIAALARLGFAYADFARNILESPDPKGLDADQLDMYRAELGNLAMPLEDKAAEALEKALGKAYELSLYNAWTLEAQEQLNKFKPGLYGPVRPVSYRGSEYFATADVAREVGGAPQEAASSEAPAPTEAPPAAPPAEEGQPTAQEAQP